MSWFVLLAICVLLSALASVFLKIGSSELTGDFELIALAKNHNIWFGALFYASAFIVYIYVLRVVPLSLAQPVVTVGVSVVTVLVAVSLFRESMALINWIGLVLICVGIFFLFFGRT